MKNHKNDWRLQGQEKYLQGKMLVFKNYADRKIKTDHDHCEFCSCKFSDTVLDSLKIGYATKDNYYWICEECFANFEEKFNWTVEK